MNTTKQVAQEASENKLVKQLLYVISIALLSLLLYPMQSAAKEGVQPGDERFTLSAGVFFPSFDTQLTVNNTDLDLGTDVDLENDFGLKDSETVFWFGGTWRFAPRHRLGVSYFQFSRDATKTLLRDIEIDDEVYPAGASVESEFKLQTIPITYYYTFRKRQDHHMAFSVGLHWMSIDLTVVGKAGLGPENVDGKASATADAPMPLLGLEYEYYFNRRWTTNFHGEIFSIDLNDDVFTFSGTITNLSANTIYYFFDNLGAGIAVNYFTIDVDIKDDNWQGGFDYEYFGPQLFITSRF